MLRKYTRVHLIFVHAGLAGMELTEIDLLLLPGSRIESVQYLAPHQSPFLNVLFY